MHDFAFSQVFIMQLKMLEENVKINKRRKSLDYLDRLYLIGVGEIIVISWTHRNFSRRSEIGLEIRGRSSKFLLGAINKLKYAEMSI